LFLFVSFGNSHVQASTFTALCSFILLILVRLWVYWFNWGIIKVF